MANEEQLAILREGVHEWNEWRKNNPDVQIDLRQAKLRRAYLRWANLAEANLAVADLTDADLGRADLRGANLFGADLINTDLLAANLTEAKIGAAVLSRAYLEGAILARADLEQANFVRAWLEGADLRATNLTEANLTQADLTRVNLAEAKLEGAYLTEVNLLQANLENANLERAVLERANLAEANMERARLKGAHLGWANLMGASLRQADLRGANLREAILTGAKLDSADFTDSKMGSTTLGANRLDSTIGLDTIGHLGGSTIGTDTLQMSKGKIPIEFLRGCGLSDLDIEYSKLANLGLDTEQVTEITYKIHQLYLGGGIQYYSCFISYSSKDQEFAQHLHNDLQNNSVRCWFAPEDMKIGDQIRPRIDQEIQLRDKLLVILSENSVKSEWVGDEVEAALEEESKSDRLVLFPIRLDDTVMKTRDDWAAKIKRRRHIGDFSNWKDKASYQKAFERLLRDLKATGGEVNGE